MKTTLTIFTLLFLLTSCGEKPVVPTNFELSLSAVTGTAAFPGGIILKGTNGVDKFQVGYPGNRTHDFSLELPSGDWTFHAIGWLGDGSGSQLQGQSRCGSAQAKIENEDSVVKLSLGVNQCSEPLFGESGSFSETSNKFDEIHFVSCLTTANVPLGATCADGNLNELSGVSSSLRVVYNGISNFGEKATPLISKCFNRNGANQVNQDFTDGLIETTLNLPNNADSPFSLSIIGYENIDCQKRNATYSLLQGLNGAPGPGSLSHKIKDFGATRFIQFADNYVGHGNSLFLQAGMSDLLPEVSCQATGCYPNHNRSYSPTRPDALKKDMAKEGIWKLFGNSQKIDSYDIQEETPAQADLGNLTFTANNLGAAGNNVTINFFDGAQIVECNETTIDVSADFMVGVTEENLVNFINSSSCAKKIITAQTDSPSSILTTVPVSISLSSGTSKTVATNPEVGALSDIKKMLLGPIGSLLFKNGIQDQVEFCTDTTFNSIGTLTTRANGRRIDISFLSPSASANLPLFADPADTFNRKIMISHDGTQQEAIYLNCVTNRRIGAFLREEEQDDGTVKKEQIFWDTRTASSEWVEYINENITTNGFRQKDYFLFKAVGNTLWHAWALKADERDEVYLKSKNYYDGTNSKIYSDTYPVDQSDTDGSIAIFDENSILLDDVNYSKFSAPSAETLTTPSTYNSSMTTQNNFFNGYSIQALLNGASLWDLSY